MAPSKNKLLVLVVAAAMLTIGGILVFTFQTREEQEIINETQESVLRQDRQHLQEEIQATEQAAINYDSASSTTAESALSQSFSGTLRLSSYHERASEAGAPVSMFPDAPIMLLVLETPTSVTGYSFDDAPSVREITVIRVPGSIGTNGEKASIEIQGPVYWASDVSGLLWDLDLSELESLKAEVH